jgi:hypothetical protein
MLLYCSKNTKKTPQPLTGALTLDGGRGNVKQHRPTAGVSSKAVPVTKKSKENLPEKEKKNTSPTTCESASASASAHPAVILPPQEQEPLKKNPSQEPAQIVAAETKHKRSKSAETPTASSKDRRRPRQHRRHVSFHSVDVQEYNVTVGAYTYCDVLPVSLDWSHSRRKAFAINDYEAMRRHASHRKECQLHMDLRDRLERLILVSGMSEFTVATLEQQRKRQYL